MPPRGRLIVGGDGLAVGGLVAGGDEAIEGERVVLGHRALLFEEAAEDAGFDGISVTIGLIVFV